jgi:hypothetical protein
MGLLRRDRLVRNALLSGLLGSVLSLPAAAQAIPPSLLGTWKIVKILPTQAPSCWDEKRASTLVGSTLRYQKALMTWKGGSVPVSEAFTRTLTAGKYAAEYKISLASLGLKQASVTEIDLQHEDADVTGFTTEVPGDTILLAGPGHIVVSACSVYFVAERVANEPAGSARRPGR